jgi:hypothetical protein
VLVFTGCDGDDNGSGGGPPPTATPAATNTVAPPTPTSEPTQNIPGTVPDFSAATFSNPTVVDNQFFPLVPGTAMTYLAEAEDEVETVVVEVLDATRVVGGVDSRVVRDRVYVDELLVEDTHDWFAQDDAGNVWYMGEQVDNYEYDDEGEIIEINHDGAWETGEDVAEVGSTALPGHQMKAAPAPGNLYHQEYYPGEAEDMAEVLALDVPVTLDDGTMYSCLQTRDFTPLEPGVNEHKYYAPGVGLVLEEKVGDEERLELKGIFRTGPESIPQFDPANFSSPTEIDNPFMPLEPGATFTFEGSEDDEEVVVTIDVLAETRVVAGVTSVVVRDREYVDGMLEEDTLDWFAQDDDGNVWYMGEQVDNYRYDDEGLLIEITHDGSWEAGQDVAGTGAPAIAGIIMRARPQPGESYRQEYYPGDAEDMGFVVRLDAEVEVDGETICESCLQILDWNPLEPDSLEYKFYRSGTGLVIEQSLTDDERLTIAEGE